MLKRSEFENTGEVNQNPTSYTHIVDLISYSGLDFAEHFVLHMSIPFCGPRGNAVFSVRCAKFPS